MPTKMAIIAHMGTACRPCSTIAAKLSMTRPIASNVAASWSSRYLTPWSTHVPSGISSDMGTSMASQSFENVRLVDRTTIGAVRLDDRQRSAACDYPRDDVVERRGALNAFDVIEVRRRLANRVAANEAANLALVVHHERVVGAAVERLRHA